ncbi:MAG TPA: dihydrofolate reductase [Clostridia bacterium]|nr:dihydrofolate reductase [Clostridia bacterium]
MKAIVAVDSAWGIGKNNGLLFSIREDMKHFMEHTMDKVVVMGSNTLLSFPNGKPLKNRVNIVLWPDGNREDVVLVKSIEEVFAEVKKYNPDDVFVVGGAMFYRTMLPYCSEVLVTKVQAEGYATVFFENLDELSNWTLENESEVVDNGEYKFTFCTYRNNSVRSF